MQNRNLLIIVVAVVLVLGLVAVLGLSMTTPRRQDSAGQVTPTPVPVASVTPSASATPTSVKVSDTIRTINIEAGSYYFNPKEIRVKKGETVKIVLTSKDMMHDFVIDELKVKVPVTQSGQTKETTFTATQTGTFEYYCSVGNHRKMGQVGKLIVE